MNADQPIWLSTAPAAPRGDGPLAGIRFGVKDNIDVTGLPTTAACPDLADRVAERSATAVRLLVEAGAVVAGKTNMDQFATGLVGTRSPYGACHAVDSAAHISGGSSSGSAIAVAGGEVALALGTDTAGSGRVPAAFNGLVGAKPTRGLVSTAGVLPACRSLDCVTTFTRTVREARAALDVLVAFDPADPWSRPMPPRPPAGVAAEARVLAVPDGPLDLGREHTTAWKLALAHAATVARLVPVDIEPFLAAGKLLYGGPWVAERWAGFGHLLGGPSVDPTVRRIVAAGRDIAGPDVFAALDALAALRRATEPVFAGADALLLPTTPVHPTLAEVAADPVGVNARLGTYTTFVNLLDLCAIAVPAGRRADGLPFGVQLIGPAFADPMLIDLAARWCGEPATAPGVPTGHLLLAVAGAHLSGLPLNPRLIELGGTLRYRTHTAPGHRLYRLPGTGVPRPALAYTGDGPDTGIAVEVWQLPHQAVGALLPEVPAPLALGTVRLRDGNAVPGFVAAAGTTGEDISRYGGWRAWLAASTQPAGSPAAATPGV